MALQIITGTTGSPHITAEQDAMWHRGIWSDNCIIKDGNNMASAIQSNNEIRIKDGICCIQGRFACIEAGTYESVRIDNGLQGQRRIDLIVVVYEKNRDTNYESMSLAVKKGISTTSTPSRPAYTNGRIGVDRRVEVPIYEVHLNGLSITNVVGRLEVVEGILKEIDDIREATGIDQIIEKGTWTIPYGKGEYIKYKSGRVELTGYRPTTIGSSSWKAWGSLYYVSVPAINYPPSLFVERPVEVQSVSLGDNGVFSSAGENSQSTTGNTAYLRPSTISSNITPRINYHIVGRWK